VSLRTVEVRTLIPAKEDQVLAVAAAIIVAHTVHLVQVLSHHTLDHHQVAAVIVGVNPEDLLQVQVTHQVAALAVVRVIHQVVALVVHHLIVLDQAEVHLQVPVHQVRQVHQEEGGKAMI